MPYTADFQTDWYVKTELGNVLYRLLANISQSNNSTSPNIVKVVRQTFDSYDVKSSKLEHTPKVIVRGFISYDSEIYR